MFYPFACIPEWVCRVLHIRVMPAQHIMSVRDFLLHAGNNKSYGIETSWFNLADVGEIVVAGFVLENKVRKWFHMSIGTIGYFDFADKSDNPVGLTTNLGWEPKSKMFKPLIALRNDFVFYDKIESKNLFRALKSLKAITNNKLIWSDPFLGVNASLSLRTTPTGKRIRCDNGGILTGKEAHFASERSLFSLHMKPAFIPQVATFHPQRSYF